MEGFLLIDKPAGITSHDVVARLRRVTGVARIGHAGTLDPFATGLLIVGVGRGATKLLSGMMGREKTYEATAVLGATTDTQDLTGKMSPADVTALPDEAALRAAMAGFVGPLKQTPPMYSAKKIAGKKLYELARAGEEVERKPAEITVHALELAAFRPPRFDFTVRCSTGTYVRTLAHDIGAALGVGAYLESLRRTGIGDFRVENAAKLEELTPQNWAEKLLPLTS
jgi:tRNA pseudouridine55 synthase